MEKRKILCLITLGCYLLFTILGAIITLSLYQITQTPPPEGGSNSDNLAHGIAGMAAAIVMVLTLFYTLASLLPLLLKLAHVFFNKRPLGVLCLILDIPFLAAHLALFVGALSSGDALTAGDVLLYIALLLVSAAAITTNVLTLREGRAAKN